MSRTDIAIPDPGFGPRDDLRHWPDAPGGRMTSPAASMTK